MITDSSDKCAHFATPYASLPASTAEPTFPEELIEQAGSSKKGGGGAPPPLKVGPIPPGCEGEGTTWWRPAALSELLKLKAAYPDARVVVGNTEIGIEMRYKNHPATYARAQGTRPAACHPIPSSPRRLLRLPNLPPTTN